jgi:ParB-like chromosome segregation protein Spo0J
MEPIDAALAAIELLDKGEHFTYTKIADEFNVSRVTLARRHQGRQGSQTDQKHSQQKLNPQQEATLVQYIENLTRKALPPTREMIQNFASQIAAEPVSEAWVRRFVGRHSDHLVCKWTSGMDAVRHKADSKHKYKLYFDLLHQKMQQYDIQQCNSYNMDEKGFMIGVTGRSKHVFSRRQWEKKEVQATLQDGSREWVTVLATVCGDGSALPPGIIYQSTNSSLQASWVADIEAGKHNVFVTSSPSGWTNNDIGFRLANPKF